MAREKWGVVSIDNLRVYARSYHGTWTERGIVVHAYLEPLQDNDSRCGYQLDFLVSREAGPGKLGRKQEEIGSELVNHFRKRMIAEMQAAGWKMTGASKGKEVWKALATLDMTVSQPTQMVSVKPTTTGGPADFAESTSRERSADQDEPCRPKIYEVYGSKAAKTSGAPPAYRRTVMPKTVAFRCAICGHKVVEQRLPGQAPRYCRNQACQREAVRRRVERSREKKQQAQQ